MARLGRMAHVCCRFGWFHWCFVHVSFADLGQPSNPQHQVPSPQGWGHFLRCSSFTYCIHLTSNILQDLAAFSSILFASVFGLPSNGSIRQYCHLSQCSLLSTQTQSLGIGCWADCCICLASHIQLSVNFWTYDCMRYFCS